MNREEYYREAVMCAADEADVALTPDQVTTMAKCLMTSMECESMAFGYECIPNPLNAEIESINRRHAQEIREKDKVIAVAERYVAYKTGHDMASIGISPDGHIYRYGGRITEIY